jgi:hypothetical protein
MVTGGGVPHLNIYIYIYIYWPQMAHCIVQGFVYNKKRPSIGLKMERKTTTPPPTKIHELNNNASKEVNDTEGVVIVSRA